jgi:hypothetical protein
MLILSASLLVIIFALISFLHFYWAAGGKWAIDTVVPRDEQGKPVLKTGVVASIVVGFGLLFFALYYLLLTGIVEFTAPDIILKLLGWIIPSIFLLRAIGDFKYVGFTKKIKNTTFARLDTTYFARLCLLIAVLGLLIQLLPGINL